MIEYHESIIDAIKSCLLSAVAQRDPSQWHVCLSVSEWHNERMRPVALALNVQLRKHRRHIGALSSAAYPKLHG